MLNYVCMRTIRLAVQYDGTDYHGWQVQPNGSSIQGTLQEALTAVTGEQATVTGAGRTDAGVHAIEQVAAFTTASELPAGTIKAALNAHLPDAIRILDAREERSDFHPRYDAKGKRYFYMIASSRILSPFLYRYVWRVPQALDIAAMRRALEHLRGTHDFSAFRASGCGARSTVRTITSLSVEHLDAISFMTIDIPGRFIKIVVEGDAFLRHMVRNIVGTAVEAGKGRRAPETMRELLLSRDRNGAGPTAPAHGLFLEKIIY